MCKGSRDIASNVSFYPQFPRPACSVILQYFGNKYFKFHNAFSPFHFPPRGKGFVGGVGKVQIH